tara:strand:+ start:1575 stop:2135 length:561 start_codon:yes stop_codon:yes gene_type:complete
MTLATAPLQHFTTKINKNFSYDWGQIFNMSIKIYQKNVDISKENKFNIMMDEVMYDSDFNLCVLDMRETSNIHPGEIDPIKLHQKTDDKVALSTYYYKHSEACRLLAWGCYRQNYKQVELALADFREVLVDMGELQGELGTQENYLTFYNRVMEEYNNNEERMKGWEKDGYFDYRYGGRKIYKCVK